MKYSLLIAAALSFVLTACAAPPPSNTGDNEIRAAMPGVVDHNVIPKKSKTKR